MGSFAAKKNKFNDMIFLSTPAKKGAAAKGHKLAEKFPEGLTLTDFMKKQWCLGKPIGSGGFGLIYLASMGENKSANPSHVIKVCEIIHDCPY